MNQVQKIFEASSSLQHWPKIEQSKTRLRPVPLQDTPESMEMKRLRNGIGRNNQVMEMDCKIKDSLTIKREYKGN